MNSQAVFHSIETDDLESLRSVLSADPMLANIRHADPDLHHWTALQFAAAKGKLAACRLLAESGAEVYTNPMNTYPPVIQAAWNGHQAVVDYFLNEIPDRADGTNRLGVSLVMAAREGWIDLVRKHLEADPLSVFQRGWVGETPLHWPAHNGYAEIVEALLDAGAEIEADEINCYGGKPLHWASEHEPRTTELLLRRGANVNSRNVKPDSELYGMTPLIMNATQREDCSEITALLLNAGAEIDAVDAKGKTALAYAVERGRRRIAETLRKRGAKEPD
jgi:ankyrin repeat protein